jgi:hypothetical protein
LFKHSLLKELLFKLYMFKVCLCKALSLQAMVVEAMPHHGEHGFRDFIIGVLLVVIARLLFFT